MPNEYGLAEYRVYDVAKSPLINYGITLDSYPDRGLLQLYLDIIEKEQPISLNLLCRRVAPVYQCRRIGKRLQECVNRVVSQKLCGNAILYRNGFICSSDMKTVRARYRTEDGFHERYIEDICYEELMEALRLVMMLMKGACYRSYLVRETSKALGFHSHKSKIDDHINRAFDCMVARGDVIKRDAQYRLAIHMLKFEGYKMGDYQTAQQMQPAAYIKAIQRKKRKF